MTQADKLVENYERLKERADNLNLYLSYVEHWCMMTGSDLMKVMESEFSGMPGYELKPEYSPHHKEDA